MVNPSSPRQTFRALSTKSDDSHAATPYVTPPSHRLTTRAVRTQSGISEALTPIEKCAAGPKQLNVPGHFTIPPTWPNPFSGTLEASLDAILAWGQMYKNTQCVVDTLLREVDKTTNWPLLLQGMAQKGNVPPGRGRYLVEELLFLFTRTLLPELILENRNAMAGLYDRKKQLAIRFTLRYDMLREWKTQDSGHPIAIPSLPPAKLSVCRPVPASNPSVYPHRRPFMPNILSTLIAAPLGGFSTHGVRERMKHHVTELDNYLLLTDDEVLKWGDMKLMRVTVETILHWQWLRQNNETMLTMQVHEWEALEGKADECEWIADDAKKQGMGKKEKVCGFANEDEDM